MPILSDPVAQLKASFQKPCGCLPLKDTARNCSSVCILICDITRPVPHKVLLPALIEELTGAGLDLEKITILGKPKIGGSRVFKTKRKVKWGNEYL